MTERFADSQLPDLAKGRAGAAGGQRGGAQGATGAGQRAAGQHSAHPRSAGQRPGVQGATATGHHASGHHAGGHHAGGQRAAAAQGVTGHHAGGPGAAPSSGPSGPVVELGSEAAFRELVQLSAAVPVVIDLWANASEPSKQLKQTLEKVTRELGGRVVLAHLDVEQNPRIAATLGGQSVPAVLALLKGQGFPLLQGPAPEADVRRLFDELLQVAASNGVTGSVGAGEDAEAPLSPLHQAGYDALERGELAAAKEAFAQALAEAPADELAKAALAQVELLERLEAADGATDPAAATDSLQGTLAAADADVAAGNFAQGFNRLLSAMAGAVPEDKEALRVRLLSLFDVAGPAEAAVIQARRRLAGLLF